MIIASLIRASFRRPLLVILIAIAAAVAGVTSLLNLRRDVFPDLTTPIFNVIVQNPAMAPEELEQGVAIPLETALSGLPDVRRLRSSSQAGVTQVTIEFEPDADYYRARQLVTERVTQAAAELPAGTDPPLVSSLTGRLNEILEFTLESDTQSDTDGAVAPVSVSESGSGSPPNAPRVDAAAVNASQATAGAETTAAGGGTDLMALRDLAEFDISRRLRSVPGVAAVERLGGYRREFQVSLDPERLRARSVTLDEVLHAVDESNTNASGGYIVRGATEWSIRTIGRASTAREIGATVVGIRGTVPVLLSDIADVRELPAPRRGIAHRLKGEVVSCRVVKQFGADTVQVAAAVRQALDEIARGLPKGVRLRLVYDQSALVTSSLGGVGRAVLIGAIFVVLVLMLLMGDVRAALLVTITIPWSFAIAGLLLDRLDVGLNTMTLGGLAIAVGLLVDAAIIVTENIVHRLRDGGHSPASASQVTRARDAAIEVGRPIAFATIIVIAVFSPLLATSGIEGRMYRPLAIAVLATLASALLLSLTVVPIAAARLLRPRSEADESEQDPWLIRQVKRVYKPALEFSLRRAALVRVAALGITIPAIVLGFSLGRDFMPRLDEGAFLLQTNVPPEASLAEVDRLNHRIEDALRAFPEVEDVVRRTGRAEETEDPMPHTLSDVLVVLKPDRTRTLDQLEDAMREALEPILGVSVLFTTPLGMRIDEGLGGTPADLSVRIFGPDFEVLERLAARAESLIADVPGLTDLRREAATRLPQLRIAIDREQAARAGLAPGDVVRAVRVGLVGQRASEVWVGQRRYDLVVRLQEHHRGSLEALRGLTVTAHDGTPVPLVQLATIEEALGPAAIRREGGSRRIAIEGSISGRDLASTAAEVRRRLASGTNGSAAGAGSASGLRSGSGSKSGSSAGGGLDLPPGYFVDLGGKVESEARATRSLWTALGIALLGVVVLLYLALDSIADTAVVLLTLPDAFVGAIVALWIAGETWNVSSLVGLIGLLGIAVQNSLVLLTQTRVLIAEGKPFDEALRLASIGRVRPKLMTALTAILGLLPILILPFEGTEIERPLAIVMIGGLISSTLFTLLALPTFCQLVHRWAPGDTTQTEAQARL
jgi:cobalt-zinc-cadmium resistance protein CzcA